MKIAKIKYLIKKYVPTSLLLFKTEYQLNIEKIMELLQSESKLLNFYT